MKPRPITNVPQFRIPWDAHPKDAVSWCRIGGTFVIDRGFIQLIPFRCFAMSHEAEFTECADPIRSTKIAFVNGSHELRIRSMEHRKLNSCVSKIIHKYRDIALSSFWFEFIFLLFCILQKKKNFFFEVTFYTIFVYVKVLLSSDFNLIR